ncbi:MAG TPA: type III-A CRISPR-associated protein Csm2 [Flavobacterium sp.]|nr:type III-A CRISPR-associated protein Csm2 [Flavobacterium sp.]
MRQRHNKSRNSDYSPRDNKNSKINCEKEWIEDGITQTALDSISDWCKKDLSNRYSGVSTSKLRKFYGEVKRIQSVGIDSEKGKRGFQMLKPKMAYAVGREKNNEKFKDLFEFLSTAIGYVNIDAHNSEGLKDRFSNFTQLFEAIVAYHKFHGGQE